MELLQLIFTRLKLKAKSFGFNKKELMGIAEKIADNLKLDESALEDDINASVDEQIDAVIPFLQFAQAQANRVIEAGRKQEQNNKDTEPTSIKDNGTPSQKPEEFSEEEMPAWFKSFAEKTEAQFRALQEEKTYISRKARLEALLKDTGTFGSHTVKNFNKMTFENEDAFEKFFTEVEGDLKAYNQERVDAGLKMLESVPAVFNKHEDEAYSDEEIDRIAEIF